MDVEIGKLNIAHPCREIAVPRCDGDQHGCHVGIDQTIGDKLSTGGYSVGIGVRGRYFDRLEIEGTVQYADFSKGGGKAGGGFGVQWYFTDQMAVTASIGLTEDSTTYGVGLRGT